MNFASPEFVAFALLFFPIFLLLRGLARKLWLLLASYFFYGSWNATFTLLLAASTLVDFWVARWLGRTDEPTARRRLLLVSILFNLGVLGFFKYCNFFIDSAAVLLGALGIPLGEATLAVVLPVGISFYTFQTLSYTIDVYRRQLEPCRSVVDFALYVAFFPQLVAGPIERAARLLPQLARLATVRRFDSSGFGLIALGAFKKTVLADHFADLVELTYRDPAATAGPALWIGTYAFALQIYCDFSGYSDIAVGLGRLMGVELMQNFRAPYAASGPSQFWQRWHVSLSSWLRDYLYIPLGGNRGARHTVARNLMLTMLLGGLWHGAAWNFVVWGLFHGSLLILGRSLPFTRLQQALERGRERWPARVLGRAAFFHCVCLGWAVFRAETLAECWLVWRKLLTPWDWHWQRWLDTVAASQQGSYLGLMMGTAATLVLLQNCWPADSKRLVAKIWELAPPLRFGFVALLTYLAMILAKAKPPPFIYFQF